MFAAMSVIWGMPYLLIKIAVGGVPVPVLVLARVAIGAAILLPVALLKQSPAARGADTGPQAARQRGQLAALKPVWGWVALFACVEIIIPWFVLSEAERHIASSLTGLLVASVPIIIALLSLLIGSGERLSAIRWAGLLTGLIGVALLAGPDLFGSAAGGGVARAVGEVLFVALCYASGPLIANSKLAGVPPVAMTAASLSLATIVYAPLGILDWPSALPSAKVLLSIAGLGVICTALAFLLFFALIAETGPARASVITYINPAIAVSLGVTVLGEKVTPLMLVAFGTILAGSVLATRRGERRQPRSEPAAEVTPGERSPDGITTTTVG